MKKPRKKSESRPAKKDTTIVSDRPVDALNLDIDLEELLANMKIPMKETKKEEQNMNKTLFGTILGLFFLSSMLGFTVEAQPFDPPKTIRVLRTTSGQIETIDFKEYVKNVLPNEWISSWDKEALKAGVQAVKMYGWYWVINHKYPGEGYDVKDSTADQVYVPGSATPSINQAVEETWGYVMVSNGTIFESQYIDGTPSSPEPCSASQGGKCYPGRMSQWGTQYYAEKGENFQQIISHYYASADFRPQNFSLIQIPGRPEVFWYQNAFKIHVKTAEVLNDMIGLPGWGWDKIAYFPESIVNTIANGPEFVGPDQQSEGVLMRQLNFSSVFEVQNGVRRHVSFDECQQRNCWPNVIDVTSAVLNLVPEEAGHVSQISGDVNGDGTVDATDLARLDNAISGIQPLSHDEFVRADVARRCGNMSARQLRSDRKAIARYLTTGRRIKNQCVPGNFVGQPMSLELHFLPVKIETLATYAGNALQAQVFDLANNLIVDSGRISHVREEAILKKVASQLANGVYLYIITTYSRDGKMLRTELRKLVVTR